MFVDYMTPSEITFDVDIFVLEFDQYENAEDRLAV